MVRFRETQTSKTIPGVRVGHASDFKGLTGCTVVLCEGGAVCGVDVRGSAAGTRDLAPCLPGHLVERVHAIFLSGGSAFGLDAAAGVMEYLESRRHRISGRQRSGAHCSRSGRFRPPLGFVKGAAKPRDGAASLPECKRGRC